VARVDEQVQVTRVDLEEDEIILVINGLQTQGQVVSEHAVAVASADRHAAGNNKDTRS